MARIKEKTPARVTQRDIAEAVGVSHVAVSHVLHRPHQARISAERPPVVVLPQSTVPGGGPQGDTGQDVAVAQRKSIRAPGVAKPTSMKGLRDTARVNLYVRSGLSLCAGATLG